MDKDIFWSLAIKNSCAILTWASLAVIFDKWGIALFALLFMSDYKVLHRYYRVCDKCGKHSPYAKSYNEAIDKARALGWVHLPVSNTDYCPDCLK